VDDAGAGVAPDTVGHVLISGENVTRGYFRNPEANAAAFDAEGWLRTGDLALWHDGELYVTGRSKEIIFVNGQNYYPHDLEALLSEEPGLELGKVAAAGQIEQQIKAIVYDALPGKHVDIDENLFEVGASSLALIQVHERIDELYPGKVELTELFDYPTVSSLARHLEQKLAAG
jgi:acyl-CoA synthetase (AMP-forming)/AMP-acid ligase II